MRFVLSTCLIVWAVAPSSCRTLIPAANQPKFGENMVKALDAVEKVALDVKNRNTTNLNNSPEVNQVDSESKNDLKGPDFSAQKTNAKDTAPQFSQDPDNAVIDKNTQQLPSLKLDAQKNATTVPDSTTKIISETDLKLSTDMPSNPTPSSDTVLSHSSGQLAALEETLLPLIAMAPVLAASGFTADLDPPKKGNVTVRFPSINVAVDVEEYTSSA